VSGEVDLPVVAVVHVGQRRGDAALGHNGVGFAEERLADKADGDAERGRLDGGPEAGATGADDNDIVFLCLKVHVVECLLNKPNRCNRLGFYFLNDPEIVPHVHGTHPHIHIGEHHRRKTRPGPEHVPLVPGTATLVQLVACRRLGDAIDSGRR